MPNPKVKQCFRLGRNGGYFPVYAESEKLLDKASRCRLFPRPLFMVIALAVFLSASYDPTRQNGSERANACAVIEGTGRSCQKTFHYKENRSMDWSHLPQKAFRSFINVNRKISRWQSRAAGRLTGRTNGWQPFIHQVIPSLYQPGLRVLDVGAGREPHVDVETRERFGLHVTGLDISAEELAAAPEGSYDKTIVQDVSGGSLGGPYDLILSTTVLEHVPDTKRAMQNMAAALAPGGIMAHYIPCGNAPFAWLNMKLGNRIAKPLLYALFPEKKMEGGFPAFYDRCTPKDMVRYSQNASLEIVTQENYFASEYMSFFVPFHLCDLLRQVTMQTLRINQACETFMFIAKKPSETNAGMKETQTPNQQTIENAAA